MSVGILHGKTATDRTGVAPDGRLVAVSILDDHRIAGELVAGSFSFAAYRTGSLMVLGTGCCPAAILMSVGFFLGISTADRTCILPDSRFVTVAVLNNHPIAGDLVVPCLYGTAYITGSLVTCGTCW